MTLDTWMVLLAALTFSVGILAGWAYKLGYPKWTERLSIYSTSIGGAALGFWIYLTLFA
jgi:hypothetical protein